MTSTSATPPELTRRLAQWLEYPRSSGASVSADGEWVYHISSRGGLPQAWRLRSDGGPAHLVVPGGQRVGRVLAAPEGSAVLLSIDHGGDEHWQLGVVDGAAPPASTQLRDLTAAPKVIHDPGGWRDGHRFIFSSNARDIRFFDVHELDLSGGSPPRLIHQEDALLGVSAVREGRVLIGRSNTNLDTDLILVEGERKTILTPHSGELSCGAADLAKDGVVASANPEREFLALVRYASPGAGEVLREYPGDVDHVRVDPAGTRAAITVNRDGWSELRVFDLRSNEDPVVPLPEAGTVDGLTWTPDGNAILVELSSPTGGAEIYRCDVAAGSHRRLTQSPVPLPGPTFSPRLSHLVASDGLRVAYWEVRPTEGTPRGTIISVHGGPESQSRPRFDPVLSFLVGEGWRVVLPNVRGSTGYGRTYVHLDDVRRRMDSVRDLRDLVAALASGGDAISGRIGVMGGSYGGFMVLSSITTYPELWDAAVDVVGIANFVTFLERTGPWRRKVREDEYGSLAHDREFLESISPIHHTARIRCPLLVIHGANDPRVPVSEAEQIVAEVANRGVPVEFLRYENEGHGLARRENQVEAYARAAHFMAEYLDPPGARKRPD